MCTLILCEKLKRPVNFRLTGHHFYRVEFISSFNTFKMRYYWIWVCNSDFRIYPPLSTFGKMMKLFDALKITVKINKHAQNLILLNGHTLWYIKENSLWCLSVYGVVLMAPQTSVTYRWFQNLKKEFR